MSFLLFRLTAVHICSLYNRVSKNSVLFRKNAIILPHIQLLTGIEMFRVLNVAEKNDVAKNVSNILSRGAVQRREGCSVYNKVYDFNVYVPSLRAQCQMSMTSVCGHLLNYNFPIQYQKWESVDPKVLFSAPIVQVCNDTSKKIKTTLQREIKHCSILIIWTDCDREGENIGFEIIKVCQEVNSNIRVLRAHFSEITVPAISRALASLTEPDKKVSGL